MDKRPELVATAGPLTGRRITIGDKCVRFGRSSSNDISILDEELSRNHCMIEPVGESGIQAVDFGSSNGTFVNGEQLGSEARPLNVGDKVEFGTSSLMVVVAGGNPPFELKADGGSLDLGFGGGTAETGSATESSETRAGKSSRSMTKNLLMVAAIVMLAMAIVVVLFAPTDQTIDGAIKAVSAAVPKGAPQVRSLCYEKVEATDARIFRYLMTIDLDGTLRVVLDDVPGENRHVNKSAKLDTAARLRIAEIFDKASGWSTLEPAHAGPSAADENALNSWRIRVVRGDMVEDVQVENTIEPEPFAAVRNALEAFSRNQLGIWAIQYSRDKLLELSAESEKIGDQKWTDREVELGNISEAVKHYREAVYYLDTVNPKPPSYPTLKGKMDGAVRELNKRYADQRFQADKALKMMDWASARLELRMLLELVPDPTDQRHVEAKARLVDVENRLKTERNGGLR